VAATSTWDGEIAFFSMDKIQMIELHVFVDGGSNLVARIVDGTPERNTRP
jgi:hypothetical protein